MANYELSNRIYELRTQKGLSQKELGAILGVSNKAVSKWETGTALPKTETLIKLAEVFEISTEELLNMALPLQNAQPTNESIIITPANARMGKTLSEFRAENGLFLKDVAEKIGVSENELKLIEESNLVPNEIAEKLVVAYNLPTNDFAKPIFKSKTVTKKHFLKISALYQIILGFIGAIPIAIGSILVAFGTFLDSDALLEASTWISDIYYFLSPIIITVGSILLGKYLTEKTGYFGDFNRYKFLYATVPSAAAGAISAFSWLIIGLIADSLRDNPDGMAGVVHTIAISAVELIFSLIATVVVIIVLAMLMNNVIEQNPEKRRKAFKKIAIIVTVSALVAYVIEFFNAHIWWNEGRFQWITYSGFDLIEDFLPYGLNVAIVWLVYSITESNPKKEKWALKILPIISIWGAVIIEIIELIGTLFDMLLDSLSDLLF